MDVLRRRIEILINENNELGECKANHEELNAVLQQEIEILKSDDNTKVKESTEPHTNNKTDTNEREKHKQREKEQTAEEPQEVHVLTSTAEARDLDTSVWKTLRLMPWREETNLMKKKKPKLNTFKRFLLTKKTWGRL